MISDSVRNEVCGFRREHLAISNFSLPMRGLSAIFLTSFVVLCLLSFSGCVRLAGTAGTWKTDAEGETSVKSAGFDTNNLLPAEGTDGKITT